MPATVHSVKNGSIAQELNIENGDVILTIDGAVLWDLIDYNFYCKNEIITVEVLKKDGGIEEIEIELDNYVLLSPDALPLDDKYKKSLQDIIANEPLALIEYWSVDPDYDGETFRSKWQDYRENVKNDNDPYRVIKQAKIQVPIKEHRKVCVKAVDVFGFESVTVKQL